MLTSHTRPSGSCSRVGGSDPVSRTIPAIDLCAGDPHHTNRTLIAQAAKNARRRQRAATGLEPLQDLGADLLSALFGILMLFALMFGLGWLALGMVGKALAALAVAAGAGASLHRVAAANRRSSGDQMSGRG